MIKRVVVLSLIGVFALSVLGTLDLLAENTRHRDGILSSLDKDEVAIEFAYYKGIKNQKIALGSEKKVIELINKEQLRKKVSCLGKFKEEISRATSVQNSHGILIVNGKAIKKKSKKNEKDYVIFKGKINFSSKDKNCEWEAFPQLALLNGKETFVGGFNDSTGGWVITAIATW